MFSKIFIDRPKFALVISIVISLIGLLCLFRLPIAEYPELAPPCVRVTATYPGATSDVIVETVASVIEEEANGIENSIYFSSDSDNNGNYFLNVYFKPGTDDDIAQVNVQNAVQRAETKLPPEVKAIGVKVAKRSSDMIGIYSFTTDGSELNLLQLANYVRMNVRDRLARIDGMTDTEILGERNYSMRVWLDPLKLSSMEISTDEVVAAIQSQNLQAAAGTLGGETASDYVQLKIDAMGRLKTPEQFKEIIVRTDAAGRQVTLGEIAELELGSEYYFSNAYLNGEHSIAVGMYRQTGANAVTLIKNANAEMEEIAKRFPKGVSYILSYDPTEFIRRSISEIAETLVMTLVLVVLVTFVFLQDWRATIIPAVAIPVSLLGTFFVMLAMGYSINVLTMFGLILVIGLLVDDGIIVVENAVRLIEEEHLSPYDAAVKSMHQTTGAILASTFVMVAFFAPLSFFGGIVGIIYKQFSLTMCIAIIFSAVNALTLSPALCALVLRPYRENRKKFFLFRFFEWFVETTKLGYIAVSKVFIRRVLLTIVVLAALLYGNWIVFKQLNTGFIPNEDKGALLCEIVLPPGASLKRTDQAVLAFQDLVSPLPGVERVTNVAGYSFVSGSGENYGLGIVDLTDWDQRKTPELQIDAINNAVMAQGELLPYGTLTSFQPPAIMGLGVTGGVTFALCVSGDHTPKDLEERLGRFLGDLNNKEIFPDVAYAFSSFNASTPEVYLDIDRQKAEALGVPVGVLFSTLQQKIASFYVNDFNLYGYSFKVKVQGKADSRSNIGNLDEIMITSTSGDEVPLSALARIRSKMGAHKISRFKQSMDAAVTVIPVPGASTGVIMDRLVKHVDEAVNDPGSHDYTISWTDMSFHQKGNEGKLFSLMVLALAFGYLFLAAKYESWTVPLPVLLSCAFATLGGLGAMWFNKMSLDIYAQLSLIMLLGLSAKISILMVEFAKQEREQGVPIDEAAIRGARYRYRAVMMTAGCFVVGVLPLMFATGAGAVSRNIVGISTGWGMIVAGVVGVAFVPPFYSMCQKMRETTNGFFARIKKK
ncbi:MAG: efflux RND transporter permease subunit [Thermoguttaceae bacterium]|nr:efflux RND transporter permease subunit [Thermoguttaceae bacterium]